MSVIPKWWGLPFTDLSLEEVNNNKSALIAKELPFSDFL